MKKLSVICFCLLSTIISHAQSDLPTKEAVLNKFGFSEYLLSTKEDTVYFYLQDNPSQAIKSIVLYLQGTSPDPLFTVEKEIDNFQIYRWFPGDYKQLEGFL